MIYYIPLFINIIFFLYLIFNINIKYKIIYILYLILAVLPIINFYPITLFILVMWDKLYFNYNDDTVVIKKTKFNNFLFKKYLKK